MISGTVASDANIKLKWMSRNLTKPNPNSSDSKCQIKFELLLLTQIDLLKAIAVAFWR